MTDENKPPLLKNHWAKEAAANSVARPLCRCLERQGRWSQLQLHTEVQDTASSAWARLLKLIDVAAEDQREEFSPGREMTPEQWTQITTLPASIAKLKSVKHLILYGSSLVRIPPEIGEMSSLEQFTPYTSYRLHWFPFEILRCKNLKRSTVSTRALYGNYKNRPPFPKLPQLSGANTPANCSICASPLGNIVPLQYWLSVGVATDVLPLLIHACSRECLASAPPPAKGYVPMLHRGGLGLHQPPAD